MDRQRLCPGRDLTFEDPIFRRLLPEREVLSLEEIALSLARIPRFLGHTHSMGGTHSIARGCPDLIWSVAQHSVLVCDLVDEKIALEALLHDAHEALIGDITRPVQEVLEGPAGPAGPALPGFGLSELKDRVQAVVHRELGLDWPLSAKTARLIREADELALSIELCDLVRAPGDREALPVDFRKRAPLQPLRPAEALTLFLDCFETLYQNRQKTREGKT